MAEPVRVPDITVVDWQAKVGEIGAVVESMDDIDQCIRTILSTPKGTLPHDPDFGTDLWRFLDWPVNEARAQVIREVIESIERWEPRVEVVAVTCGPLDTDPATLAIQIVRRRKGSSAAAGALVLAVTP